MKEPMATCPEAFFHGSLKCYLLHDPLQMAWSGALSCSVPSQYDVSSSIIACGIVFSATLERAQTFESGKLGVRTPGIRVWLCRLPL